MLVGMSGHWWLSTLFEEHRNGFLSRSPAEVIHQFFAGLSFQVSFRQEETLAHGGVKQSAEDTHTAVN